MPISRPQAQSRPSPRPPSADVGPPTWLVTLLAVSCGLTVANIYYAQPLLDVLRQAFRLNEATAGSLVTVTQIGFAAGMVFLVPLGDRLESRRLVTILLTVTTLAMAVGGLAPSFPVLLLAALVSGTGSVVAQVLVPYVADLAPDHTRGRVVGRVMSGLLAGILLSRTLGSLLEEATNWRTVYLASAVLMAALTLTLRVALPRRAPTTTGSYRDLLASTLRLARIHGPLRRRSLYQAAMFGTFSAFWTTISYVLTAAPFHYSQFGIGIFALVGAAGALVAPLAGKWADRGLTRPMTAAAFLCAIAALAIAGFGRHSVVLLAAAAILLDLAAQSSLILGQHTIYQLDHTARARLNSVYIATFFIGGAFGSQIGAVAYHLGGWTALTLFAAALPVLALLGWATERRAQHRSGSHPS
ncbi:MFS transporter [Streptomyces kronopolitis]|uniref:MFS transporter n=1 Tax=Streptomyces kronopolitis TaxID=1612435 RepID=UPI00368F7934